MRCILCIICLILLIGPASAAAPTVTGITPSTGLNTTAVAITNLAGTGFASGATMMLTPVNARPAHMGSIMNGDGGALLSYPLSVYVVGNYAYVVSESNALEIVDVTNPAAPVHKGSITDGTGSAPFLNRPQSVYVSGNYAYTASFGSNALEIVDVTDPAHPVHKGSISNGNGGALLNGPYGVYVAGTYAYVASYNSNALEIVNVTDPAHPVHAGNLTDGMGGALLNQPFSVWVAGNYAYVTSAGSNALEIINITNRSAPVHEGSIVDGDGGALLSYPVSVYVAGTYAYVISDGSNALEIVDIADPAHPVHAGSIANGDGGALLSDAWSVYVTGNYACVASMSSNALEIVNVTDPAHPVHAGSIADGAGGALLSSPNSVYVAGTYAYVASTGSNALEVVDIGTVTGTGVMVHSLTWINGTFDLSHKIAGPYNVVVTNPDGQSGTLIGGFSVASPSPPVADFTATSTSGTVPLTVTFTDSSTGSPTSWNWSLGDGTYNTTQDPVHTYTHTGTYTVNLTVTSAGGSDTKIRTGYISVGAVPAPAVNGITPAYGANTTLVTVTNLSGSGFTTGATVLLTPGDATPLLKGSIANGEGDALLNSPAGVAVSGNYAYVASSGSNALEIVNITNRSAPVHRGNITNGMGGALLTSPAGVAVSGSYVYVASYLSNALEIVNVSDPAAPIHKGSIANGAGGALLTSPQSVYVSGNYAYVASSGSNALEIVNISDPAAPVHKGSLSNGAGGALLSVPYGVYVSGTYAYIASAGSSALEIVNVSDPAHPIHAGSIANGAGGALLDTPYGVWVAGNYAYVVSHSNALEIVNTSDPAHPVHVGSIANGDGGALLNRPYSVSVSGNYAYITSYDSNAFEVVDVSDPAHPIHAGDAILNGPNNVCIAGSSAYVTSGMINTLEIFDIHTVPGTGVTVASPLRINCTLDLRGKPSGSYNIIVTNPDGQSGMLPGGFSVTPPPAPVANFSAAPVSGTAPLTVTFTDSSTNTPFSWNWSFGDGQYGTAQNPVHTYTQAGSHTVNLTAANGGGSNTTSKPDYITVSSVPSPTVTGITPATGMNASGILITNLSGTSFATGATMMLTPVNATPVHKGNITNGNGGALLWSPASVFVSGNYAYVASPNSEALEIVNVSNPAHPFHTGSITNGAGGAVLVSPQSVFVSGNYAYVASEGSNALEIVNITNRSAPVHMGSLSNGAGGAILSLPESVFVSGNYAYVASFGSNALEIVNVTNRSAPVHAGSITNGTGGALLHGPVSVYVAGNYAYVASSDSNALEIVDISDPAHPAHAGSLTDSTGGALLGGPHSVFVSGNYAYVGSDGSNALEIVDVSDPANPVHTGSITDGDGGAILNSPDGICVAGNYAYITSEGSNALEIVDVTNPAHPVHKASISSGAGGALPLLISPLSVFVSGSFAYVASEGSNALEVIDISTSTGTGVNVISPTRINGTFDLTHRIAGPYNVVVTNPDGRSGTLAGGFVVTTPPLPVADFTATPRSGVEPLMVTFTDRSALSPTAWNWSFGDGNFSALQNPSHTYKVAGTFSVSLNVTNVSGYTRLTRPSYITVNAGPAPTVTGITPATGENTGIVSVSSLAGTGFIPGATVMLAPGNANPVHKGNIISGSGGALLNGPGIVYVSGNYAYVPSYLSNALEIVNISDPAHPVHAGSIVNGTGQAHLNGAWSVYVSGNYAYVASFDGNALEIVNVSDPAHPAHKGYLADGSGGALLNQPYNVYVSGNYAYVASSVSNALEIVNITDPAHPVHKGSLTDGTGGAVLNQPYSVYVSGNYAYVASYGSNALEIVDVSDPAHPVHAGSLTDGTGGALLGSPQSVYISGTSAYVASSDSNALEIIDVTDPAHPVHKGSLTDGTGGAVLNQPYSVYVSGNYAYLTAFSSNALEVVNVSDPAHPAHSGSIVNGTGGALLSDPYSVYVSGDSAYVSSYSSNALEILDTGTVTGTNVTVISPTWINCTLDLMAKSAGQYDVVVTNPDRQSGTLAGGFSVIAPGPIVSFTGTPTRGTAPLTVVFTDTSTGSPTSWNWSFGDGSLVNSTDQNPVHTYDSIGTYTVSLNATNTLGSNLMVRSNYITADPAPSLLPIRTIPAGGAVYIGESGLNITECVGPAHTIAWFPADADVSATIPNKTFDVQGMTSNFFVDPANYTAYTGTWYNWSDGNTISNASVAFRVIDPALDIRIIDMTTGADITGRAGSAGDEAGFRIDSDLADVTGRGVEGAPVTIRVQGPYSRVYSTLVNNIGTTYLLQDIPVSDPSYSTGPVWNTGNLQYPPGNYTISAESDLNQMRDSYDVAGKTVVADKTVFLSTSPVSVVPPPTITLISPVSGYRNSTIIFTLDGHNFQPGPGNTTVQFRNQTDILVPTLTNVTATRIDGFLVVPEDATAGSWNIRVITMDSGENTLVGKFTVVQLLKPTITSMTPTSGVRTSLVTFTLGGTNFQPGAGNTNVTLFNTTYPGVITARLTSVTLTAITGNFTIPVDAAFGKWFANVTTVSGGTSTSPVTFTVTQQLKPAITSITPATGFRNTTITFALAGSNFQVGTGSNVSFFNQSYFNTNATSIYANITSVTSTSIT
ncbi:MAG: PKD domain-containing protein, partial [Methanoregula sp.]|uniref:PKD domain-containing protein n=1 Tax=Methanoregula sp. TaxID=2052170 RepID=UPI003C232206